MIELYFILWDASASLVRVGLKRKKWVRLISCEHAVGRGGTGGSLWEGGAVDERLLTVSDR